MKQKFFSTLMVLLLAGCFDDGTLKEFRVVESIGGLHYAVIDPVDVAKRDAIYEAAKKHCDAIDAKSAKPGACYVVFWADASLVPTGLEMTEESRAGQVALYKRGPGKRPGFYLMKGGRTKE